MIAKQAINIKEFIVICKMTSLSRLSNGSLDIDPPPNFNANRRRSRAVLYGIQDHYKSNTKRNKLKKINKVKST